MDRILVFSNSDSAASKLVFTLVADGLDAFLVESRSCLQAELTRQQVDLVIIDLDLRALDLARDVRTAYPLTRVVLTGSVPLTERQLERLDCGAVAFFRKPFDLRSAAPNMRAHLATPVAHSRRLWHAEWPSSYAL